MSQLPIQTNSLNDNRKNCPKLVFATYYRAKFNNSNPPEAKLYPIADRNYGVKNATDTSFRITNSFYPYRGYNDTGLSTRLFRDFS